MLIVPISDKIGFKNPPVITLTLLIINCLIYFSFQIHDNKARLTAEQFYLTSGLAAIEVPHYIGYLKDNGKLTGDYHNFEDMNADALMMLHFEMEADAGFLKLLDQNKIVTPEDEQYEIWKQLRPSYKARRNKSVAFAHGLRPAYPRLSAYITYMFLHGSVGHLVGNMLFLWILGCMLEIGSGRLLFSGIYLASGLLAAVFFNVIYPASTVPLVGASGAIAGLMGAYTVLYGIKKVHVFYSLGFYFNTANIPAIYLLPVWLTNECYQLFFTGVSHVAYVAHIGGIVGGAVLAYAGDRLVGTVDRNRFEEVVEDKVAPLMQEALEHLGNLEMRKAQALFENILELAPDNHDALMHLFNIHKMNPESEAFQEVTNRLLNLLLHKTETHQSLIECYETYVSRVGRPVLSIAMYLQIAGVMISLGKLDGAEKIVLTLLRKKPHAPGLPSSLIKLSRAFQKMGREDQWERYRSLVCKFYPDSVEAAIILKSNKTG